MTTKNVTLKVKYSQVTSTPTTLAVGELAYSTVSNAFFIGDALGSPVKIGGGGDVSKLAGIESGAQVNTVTSVASRTGAVTLTKSDVGLSNVDNTADTAKPISTATQTALDLKANVSALSSYATTASPTFTGVVTLPATGTGGLEAATKNYVDAVATGLSVKDAVRVATTANGTLSTAFANGQVVDGVTLATGDRILLKNQTDASQNGIYVVPATGTPSRSSDADNTPGVEVKTGMMVFVTSGTANTGTQWVLTTTGVITLGSTNQTYVQFGGGTSYSAGTGLSLAGSTFSLAAHSGNLVTSGTVASSYLPSTLIYDGDTMDGGSF
jgi:hypothetical protein